MPEWLLNIDRSGGNIPLDQALVSMVGAALLSSLLGFVYLQVHPQKIYGRSLVITQVSLSVVIAGIIMVIGNSVAVAFGAFGVLGLARFRTDFPDPRDTAAVVSSIAVGMACGLQEYRMALVATMVLIAIQGAGWLWGKDEDDEYWQGIATRGRDLSKKKKKKTTNIEETEALPETKEKAQ